MTERRKSLPEIDEELRSYIDSVPPPPALQSAIDRLAARFDPESSAIHNIAELQRQQSEFAIDAVRDRYEIEREKRLAAESQLKAYGERFWAVVTGVLVLLIAGALIGLFTLIMKK